MKCPNCGLEIPEGHMYCDSCGTEINIVPDFEPEVENQINDSLSNLADELNKEDRLREEAEKRKKAIKEAIRRRWRLYLTGAITIGLVVICVLLFTVYEYRTAVHYLDMASDARNTGDLAKAIEYLREGHEKNPENSDIIFRLSDYSLENGDYDAAADALMDIVTSDSFSEDMARSAYESIIAIYRDHGETDKIASLLEMQDTAVSAAIADKYVPSVPRMNPGSGNYTVGVSISLISYEGAGSKVFYTVNGGEPDEESILYDNEILLDTEGEYTIRAVVVNEYGIKSEVALGTYIVEKGAPEPPVIMEDSGEYNQNTMIVALADAGCTIYYTTDGSEPTKESKQYISPITMPVGKSLFRFICYDSEGNYSDIVDREYHLVYTRLISTDQAVSSLVNTLVRLDILLDNTGKVRGQDGHNEYIYEGEIEVQGAGEYYKIVENHVMGDGTTTATGLIYAVNTHDGTVNRLGYDSSGNYTLITISNR